MINNMLNQSNMGTNLVVELFAVAESSGVSMTQLSMRSGVPMTTLRDYRDGRRLPQQLKNIEAAFAVLGYEIDAIKVQ